jgi:hypothetical protein
MLFYTHIIACYIRFFYVIAEVRGDQFHLNETMKLDYPFIVSNTFYLFCCLCRYFININTKHIVWISLKRYIN